MSYIIHDKNLIDVLCGEVRELVKSETSALEEYYAHLPSDEDHDEKGKIV